MNPLRERLAGSRPDLGAYRKTLGALPDEIAGIRGVIAALAVHPIKALSPLHVLQAGIEPSGLWTADGRFGDRMAMLVKREEGTCKEGPFSAVRFSQREEPRLALTQARRRFDTDETGRLNHNLVYSGPGLEDLEIETLRATLGADALIVRMFPTGELVRGFTEKGPITHWVREFLRKNVPVPKYRIDDIEVLLLDPEASREVEEMHRAGTSASTLYSDGGQLLTTSARTLEWMNAALREQHGPGFREIDMQAFRPNIVVEGWPTNVEDLVRSVFVQGRGAESDRVQMLFGGLCVRCPVTQVDGKTGERPDKEPLAWLSKNRPKREGSNAATFGVNTTFDIKAEYPNPDEEPLRTLTVGDAVVIEAERE